MESKVITVSDKIMFMLVCGKQYVANIEIGFLFIFKQLAFENICSCSTEILYLLFAYIKTLSF